MAVQIVMLDYDETTNVQELLDGMNRLMPRVSSSYRFMTLEHMYKMIESPTVTFLAWVDDKIVGMASMTVSYLPNGIICEFHNVVVDEIYRKQGVGTELVVALIKALPEGWRRVVAHVFTQNSDIVRILLKSGFRELHKGYFTLSPR